MALSQLCRYFASDYTKALFPRLHRIVLLAIPLFLLSGRVTAQIIPDNTLPNNSIVTPNGNSLTIDGGTTAGSNLFHSFREFSIPTGTEAFFNNATNIQNIFSRITGGKISNIDGLIRANGSANLFLINPSGIIFGTNAQLNIGGSFIGTTANSLQFADGSFFNATNPNAPPLLTVNVPIGLQWNGQNSGAIRVNGVGHSLTVGSNGLVIPPPPNSELPGLQVKPGRTLALVGGEITVEGGILAAESGRIEIGSVSQGTVKINPTNTGWNLSYLPSNTFADINLSAAALVDASGDSSSGIQFAARNLNMSESSFALIFIRGNSPAAAIEMTASGTVEIIGIDPKGNIGPGFYTDTQSSSQGGDIIVNAQNLRLIDGGSIYTNSQSESATGTAGNIKVNVAQTAEVIGASPSNVFGNSVIGTGTEGDANTGDITVSASRFRLIDAGALYTYTGSSGNSGNVTINARDVEVIGTNRLLEPSDRTRSFLSTSSFGSGTAGKLTINTSRLVIRSGGIVTTGAFASGNGDNLTINASESIEVSGGDLEAELYSRLVADAPANTVSQMLLEIPLIPSGNAGSLTIRTPKLAVFDRGSISVENQGTGNAGEMRIIGDRILLDTGGTILASTASGEGGNINLQVRGDVILRNGSQISAEAGGSGNGGNFIANTNTLTILEGSKVTANAFLGNGGNIGIATQGLFADSNSRITASSNFGVSGTISINNPNLDPSSGLVQLPQNVVDPTTQIAQGCTSDEGNTFTIAGRGGLPEEPTATIHGLTLWQDLENYAVESSESRREPSKIPVASISETPSFVEAAGWQKDANGEVELVANLPNGAEVTRSDRASIPNCPRQKIER